MARSVDTLAERLIEAGAVVTPKGTLKIPRDARLRGDVLVLPREEQRRLASTVAALLALNESEQQDHDGMDGFIAALVASTEAEYKRRHERARLLRLAELTPGELRARVLRGSVTAEDVRKLRKL